MKTALGKTAEILIIDDSDVDREVIKRYLRGISRDVNFVFHETPSVVEAERLLRKKTYACVFLDDRLPDGDGISLLKKFYDAETDLASSPVIMLTRQGSESVMLDALRCGAQDYLMKSNLSEEMLGIAIVKARELFEAKRARRQAEEQLQLLRKMEAVGQLTSGVAHDFNNLLTVIVGNIYLLRRRLQNGLANCVPEDVAKKIDAIDTAAERGTELVRRLMVFARQTPLQQDITDIAASVMETTALLKSTLGEDIAIKTLLREDIWPVFLDAGEFENILINLSVNARDAMPQGGTLTVEVENVRLDETYALAHPGTTEGDYVMVAVSDTGMGMPPEVRKRIFEPFFTTKPPGEGTGLGMSMAYGFVQQCGGHIHVYSEEGRGTVFRIYLPRYQEEGIDMSEPHRLGPEPEGRETILVAEDDEVVRMMTVAMLERLGYTVLQAPTARTALEMLKKEHKAVDLVFTDIVMPDGMSGIDLVNEMRVHYPGIKALYTSGYTENAIPDYRLREGEQLLSKPYRRDFLAQKIREVLDAEAGAVSRDVSPPQKARAGY